MNAFRLSGEKAAAVAPAMLRATVAPVLLTMKTWLGVSAVSETMILLPSGEIARTFPGADLFSLTLVETTINPLCRTLPGSCQGMRSFLADQTTMNSGWLGDQLHFRRCLPESRWEQG